jgi:preprotein translocase subunit SecA
MAGRGVDILLGGNPSGLADDALALEGIARDSEEGELRHAQLVERFNEEVVIEADKVRELGGLYVLGSERHESRRIDNQLRGRAGRQGDPGESRFYLSLEDELMRLFATGAMSWVMDKALPDDVPIEARMVTKAIERAQNTVEQKNAEVRKDVLKYDEVMNEQRKVIYERRMQVIDNEDLRAHTLDLLDTAVDRVVHDCCSTDFAEDWDLSRLVHEISSYYPTKFSVEDLAQAESVEQLFESVSAEANEFYEQREQSLPGGEEMARQIERQIMLQLIDQRWRQHLSEMDYLREGIHLRGIAQTDPLVAWQREGFEMFGHLMEAVDDDFLRHVTHVEVLIDESQAAPDYSKAIFEAADEPVAELHAQDDQVIGEAPNDVPNVPVTRAQMPTIAGVAPPATKIGRNDPCPCGSGRKFKLCHGAN